MTASRARGGRTGRWRLPRPTIPNWDPWGQDVMDAVSRSHEIVSLDPSRPVVDQVADRSIDAIVDHRALASPELAEAAGGHVRLWQLGSVGADHIDFAALDRFAIPVARCPGSTSARALAEQALMVLRQFRALDEAVEAVTRIAPTGRQLAGRTLLIIGLGASGRALATRAAALGMPTIAIRRRGPGPEL